jgi:hypothetical protein
MSNKLDIPVDPTAVKNSNVQVSNVMKDEFGFNVPIESVPLPSRGIIYSVDSSLNNQETLDIKPMTAREEDILTSRAYIKKGTVLSELIKSCLVNKSIDPNTLISGDRNALLVALRITGYGSEYAVEIDCPSCSVRNKATFDLAQLKIKRLEIAPVVTGENLFEVVLPVSKKSVKVKFLTGKDEIDMMITDERKKKAGMLANTAITDRLSRSIVEIENITDKNKISIFVRNMPVKDSHALRKFLDNNEPGIIMKDWFSCNHCDEQSEVVIPMGATFFWPDV